MNHIHYFNPGHENAVLNRLPSYTAPASMTTLMRELASLPAWYTSYDRLVLVGDEYDIEYHNELQNLGLKLSTLLYSKELKEYNGAEVCMWGISPQAIRVFEAFNSNYSLALKVPSWSEKFIYLNSREIARDFLRDIKSESSYFDAILLPIFCSDIESIELQTEAQSRSLLAKAPYSSSGRGLLWLPSGRLTRVELQILQGMLKKQSVVSLEPVYDKKIDFAVEFMSDGHGTVSFAGYSLFSTNEKGAYEGNYLYSQSKIVEKITEYIDLSILDITLLKLQNLLSKYYGSIYRGCIGVDMMIVFENNSYILHPCVEINMRYNMGFLAIKLYENFIKKTSCGQFFLDFDASGSLKMMHQKMQKEFPLIIEDRKVRSGYLSLCPINADTKYRAYILVEDLE